MFVNYRDFNLCFFIFIITFLSSTALFCSNLTSIDDKDTACFLEPPTQNPIVLRTSGNSLVLSCHVARSKRSSVEWWYTDAEKLVNRKIYPVYPQVRPTVLRFVTSLTPYSKSSNETDILDASILLQYVNVDDSGVYRCVIRPWSLDSSEQPENILANDGLDTVSLNYQVQITAPRLCQSNPGRLPCFSTMRTSSPTIIDAYQTAFLPCVVKNHKSPGNVFWVVGDSAVNSVLITNFLTSNQYNGDRLRQLFPLSPSDYSIELSINGTGSDRVFSCVIDGSTNLETTIFTYIIRPINLEEVGDKTLHVEHKGKKTAAQNTSNQEVVHSVREQQIVSSKEENSKEETTQDVDQELEDEPSTKE